MPRYRSWLLAIAVVVSRLCPLAAAANVNVGLKAVSTDKDGNRIWTVGTTTYPVRDFGGLMPTIVYNCAYMPAICKTVNLYLGYLPGAGNEKEFHMDMDRPRKVARRDVSCPTSWIMDPDGDGRVPRCPETDQPQWTGYAKGDTTPHGPYPALLSGNPPAGKPDQPNYNRLGRYEMKFTQNEGGGWKVERVWYDLPAIFTCDEFPAASWIEGGGSGLDADGDTVAAASTYCAPFRMACDSKGNKNGQNEVWTTDQNFQGDVHNRLGDWARTLWALGTKKPKGTLTVFAFKLRTVNDADSKYAGWVEANGKVRLCLGPGLSSGGRDCWTPVSDAESKMVTW